MTGPRCEIVAEISGNHMGRLDMAEALVLSAARSGADAVKLQCWTPGTMVIGHAQDLQDGPWAGRNPQEIYLTAHTPWHWYEQLFQLAAKTNVELFASVFDLDALHFLQRMKCPRYKIASAELVDLPLIEAVAATGKPIVISTGMGTRDEIHDALEAAMLGGSPAITLLHCVSAYPLEPAQANLRTILDLSARYQGRCAIGFSDHTAGIGTAIAAAALGARMVEKHITMATTSIDAAFSLFPDQFRRMAIACREAFQSVGEITYGPRPGDSSALRRSLYASKDIKAGERLTADNVVTARPATGMAPKMLRSFAAHSFVAVRDMKRGDPIDTALNMGE